MSLVHAVCALTLLAAAPDLIPSDLKVIAVETRLDLGILADRACTEYQVQAGDTLAKIAAERLGDEARWPEIATVNPGLDPDRIAAGARLWLPPRAGKAATAVLLFAGNSARWAPMFKPVSVDAQVDSGRTHGKLVVCAVPPAALPAFLQATNKKSQPAYALPACLPEGVLMFEATQQGRLVDRKSPVARRCDVYRLVEGPKGAVLKLASSESFDAKGNKLAAPAEPKSGGQEPGAERGREEETALLLALATLGGGGLLAARARRRTVVPACA